MLSTSINKILILALLSIAIFSKTPHELVDIISNSSINVKYYFYKSGSDAFLSKQNSKGGYSVWYYTNNRKWEPIHNAKAFDGFMKANNVFDNVRLNENKTKMLIGSITNTNINDEILSLAKKIENKSPDIGWYFWSANGNAFLLKQQTNNEISIWYYTKDRKWQPIHNANAFDGFPSIEKTLDDINFNPKTNTLDIGEININFFDVDKLVPPAPFGFSF